MERAGGGGVDGHLLLQSSGAGGAVGNPQQLAHGISVALYNTAFGLIVAIPSLIFWRYFRARVDAYLLQFELSAEALVRHDAGPLGLKAIYDRSGLPVRLYPAFRAAVDTFTTSGWKPISARRWPVSCPKAR